MDREDQMLRVRWAFSSDNRVRWAFSSDNYVLRAHAYVEARIEGISQEVIAAAGAASELLEEYPDRPEGLSKLLLGYGSDDEAVHVVVNVAAFEDDPAEPVVVVTVYKPEPPLGWMNEPGADKDRPEGGSQSFPPAELRDYPSACHSCGGQVTEQRVTLTVPGEDGETRLVHEVPAGVCGSCGEQYLRAKVARALDELMASPPTRHESVPVWVFAASA